MSESKVTIIVGADSSFERARAFMERIIVESMLLPALALNNLSTDAPRIKTNSGMEIVKRQTTALQKKFYGKH